MRLVTGLRLGPRGPVVACASRGRESRSSTKHSASAPISLTRWRRRSPRTGGGCSRRCSEATPPRRSTSGRRTRSGWSSFVARVGRRCASGTACFTSPCGWPRTTSASPTRPGAGSTPGARSSSCRCEDRRLRDAAPHVTKFNLTQTKTKAYVGELLAKEADAPAVRLTAPLLIGRMKKIHETLGSASVLRKIRALHGELDVAERQALVGEIEKARDALTAVAREVRGR